MILHENGINLRFIAIWMKTIIIAKVMENMLSATFS